DRRAAWRQDLGRIGGGPGRDLLRHRSGHGRATGGTRMIKRILVGEDREDNRQILHDLLGKPDMSWSNAEYGGIRGGHPYALGRRRQSARERSLKVRDCELLHTSMGL